MTDITVEILASAVPIGKENIRYKIKTWWARVDMEDGTNVIKIPGLPMIQHYYNMTGKDTSIFVEIWYRSDEDFHRPDNMKFVGMARCQVDEQLKDSRRNPSVTWLEVYNPIDDIMRGKILIKVDAKFTNGPIPELFPVAMDLSVNKNMASGTSSYFNHQNIPDQFFASPSTADSSPSKRSVTIQTDSSPVGSPPNENEDPPPRVHFSEPVRPLTNGNSPSKTRNSIKMSRFHQKMEKACKEKVNHNTKKGEDKGSPFNVRVGGKTYTIHVDSSGPKVVPAKSSKKSLPAVNNNRGVNNDKPTSDFNTKKLLSAVESSAPTDKTGLNLKANAINEDDSVEDVIHLLNDDFNNAMLLGNSETLGSNRSTKSKDEDPMTSVWTNSASSSGSTLANPDLLKLRRQQMERVISESEISESGSSPSKFPGRLAPEGRNETETDASDFSPVRPSGVLDLGILGLGFNNQRQSHRNQNDRPRVTFQNESRSAPTMQIKVDQNPKPFENPTGRPPRSRRMAAAIYND